MVGQVVIMSVRPTPPLVEEVHKMSYQLSNVATAYQKEVFEELVTSAGGIIKIKS